MAYMDYMDLAVPRKAVKFNHSLTHLVPIGNKTLPGPVITKFYTVKSRYLARR